MDDERPPIDYALLWKKLHTALTDEEEAQLARWLREDPRHRQYFSQLQRTLLGTQSEEASSNTTTAWQRVARRTGSPSRSHRQLLYWVGIAACWLLLVAGVAWWFPLATKEAPGALTTSSVLPPGTNRAILMTDDGTTYDLSAGQAVNLEAGGTQVRSRGAAIAYTATDHPPAEVTYHTLSIPRGGEFQLTLPDQTRVWLNSETTLRFPTRFADVRRVVLSGEAYFEVAHDAERPFRIVSGDQMTEVLGTTFNVSCYEEDTLVYTTLVEGEVVVSLRDQPGSQQRLQPNHQSRLSPTAGTITQRPVETEHYVAWRRGRFAFADQPLEEIMRTLARWYDVEVHFANDTARTYRFTGNLPRYENFEKILELLRATGEVEFSVAGRAITVS